MAGKIVAAHHELGVSSVEEAINLPLYAKLVADEETDLDQQLPQIAELGLLEALEVDVDDLALAFLSNLMKDTLHERAFAYLTGFLM